MRDLLAELAAMIDALPPVMVRLEVGDDAFDAFAAGTLIPDALADLVPRWAPTNLGPEVRLVRVLHPGAWQAIDSNGEIMAGGSGDAPQGPPREVASSTAALPPRSTASRTRRRAMGNETRPCPSCGRPPAYGRVLAGWKPCNCGGHNTTLCRPDRGGCGHTRLEPPHDPEVCLPDQGHAPRTGWVEG